YPQTPLVYKMNRLLTNNLAALLSLTLLLGCQTSKYKSTATGLTYKILKKGKGPQAKPGDEVLLNETTSYRDGTVLYSNEAGQPIKIKLGAGQVTAAVEEGLTGMRTGEVKTVVAPPEMVKRSFYPDNVSPDSPLVIKLILSGIVRE
ncbi:MAG: FKBP-type peptidyl-prolyl cis-trans isomerase, partial [Bacteroidota bacterium]